MTSPSARSWPVAICSFNSLFILPIHRFPRCSIAWTSGTHEPAHQCCPTWSTMQSALFVCRLTGIAFKLCRMILRLRCARWNIWTLEATSTLRLPSCDKFTPTSWRCRSRLSNALWATFDHQAVANGQRKLPTRSKASRTAWFCRHKLQDTHQIQTCRKSSCSLLLPRM